jgi:hypothetical protein
MSVFSKVSQHANKLFSKVMNDRNFFKKVNGVVRGLDGGINKVGNFIKPVAQAFGYDGMLNNVMNVSKRVANGLEKYVSPHLDTLHNAHNSGYA